MWSAVVIIALTTAYAQFGLLRSLSPFLYGIAVVLLRNASIEARRISHMFWAFDSLWVSVFSKQSHVMMFIPDPWWQTAPLTTQWPRIRACHMPRGICQTSRLLQASRVWMDRSVSTLDAQPCRRRFLWTRRSAQIMSILQLHPPIFLAFSSFLWSIQSPRWFQTARKILWGHSTLGAMEMHMIQMIWLCPGLLLLSRTMFVCFGLF